MLNFMSCRVAIQTTLDLLTSTKLLRAIISILFLPGMFFFQQIVREKCWSGDILPLEYLIKSLLCPNYFNMVAPFKCNERTRIFASFY